MVVANLYPFKATVAQKGVSVEKARGNIDIGGPCMVRAAAKNYIRVASVVDPSDYHHILSELKDRNGCTSLTLRYQLACKAFDHTARYDRAIADFLAAQADGAVQSCYSMMDP